MYFKFKPLNIIELPSQALTRTIPFHSVIDGDLKA